MIDIYSHAGNPAVIKAVTKSATKTGATLYHFDLLVDNQENVKATAFINPALGEKMKMLARVYDKFKVGDKVHANLYKSGNFTDVYRLQRVVPKRKPKPKKVTMVTSVEHQKVEEIKPQDDLPEISFDFD